MGHLLVNLVKAGRVRRKVFLNEDNVSITSSIMNAILHLFLQRAKWADEKYSISSSAAAEQGGLCQRRPQR